MSATEREETIFSEALRLPPEERAAYVAEAAKGDDKLRQRVEVLLGSYQVGDFLEQAAAPELHRTVQMTVPLSEKPGDMIGRYKLLQQIGEGGCGVVYMAEQAEPVRRRIALKIIKLGMDTKSVIGRFEAERQALALMDHTHIAKVFDAGATDTGRPYFVMELVRGLKITDYCDEKKLSTHARLDLFIQVCQAIQHAHQKGIIHRDIKPSNILVTVNDGVAVPKVIDFGVAKATGGQQLTDKTVFTAFEQFIGTPAYMSPEQAVLTSLDIDTRSDIYALGVLLYELLTGQTPFDSNELLAIGLDEMRRTIREKEPPKPSTCVSTLPGEDLSTTAHRRGLEPPKLVSELRGDLDWIVMKCLEKDRVRRYETANGLASDIKRHLTNEPVTARPPSKLYEFQKTVRRHKVGFAATAAIIIVLACGVVLTTWQAVRATRAEREQTQLRQEAEKARESETEQRRQAELARARESELRLVAEANEQRAETEAARNTQVAQFMKDMLSGVGPSVALGRDTKLLREILDQTAGRLDELKDQPEVEADLLNTLGVVYCDLSDYPRAEDMLTQALSLRKQLHSGDHPDVARSINNLGTVYSLQNRNPEALACFEEALEMRRRLFGNEHVEVADSLYGVAWILRRGKNAPASEAAYQESLAIRRKLLGNVNLDVAKTLTGFAILIQHIDGRLGEAEECLLEALHIQRQLWGNEHPDMALTLMILGGVVRQSPGREAEAEALAREAVAMNKKLLGDHRETAFSIQALANTVTNQAEAIQLLREAFEMRRNVLGDHFETHTSLNRLVNALRAAGRPEEAEEAVRAQMTWEREHDGEETVATMRQLASVLAAAGNFDQALPLYEEALERMKATLEPDQRNTLGAITGLAYSYYSPSSNDFQCDLPLFREVMKRTEAKLGPDHLDTLRAISDLASTLAIIVGQQLQAGRFAEAEPGALECLHLREQVIPDGWLNFNAKSMLGRSLLGQKNYAEAEPLLLAGYEGMMARIDQIPPQGRPRVTETLQRLAQLCEDTDRPERAAEWKQKLAEFEEAESRLADSSESNAEAK